MIGALHEFFEDFEPVGLRYAAAIVDHPEGDLAGLLAHAQPDPAAA